MKILPVATGYEVGRFGQITFTVKNLTLSSFEKFKDNLTALIYKDLGL